MDPDNEYSQMGADWCHGKIFDQPGQLEQLSVDWRKAIVTPVLQETKKEDPENYRLIGFPLIFGAVMDHLFQSYEGDDQG